MVQILPFHAGTFEFLAVPALPAERGLGFAWEASTCCCAAANLGGLARFPHLILWVHGASIGVSESWKADDVVSPPSDSLSPHNATEIWVGLFLHFAPIGEVGLHALTAWYVCEAERNSGRVDRGWKCKGPQ